MLTNKYITKNLKLLVELVQNMSDEEFSKPISENHQSSIGQHARHIIEFVECLIPIQPNEILSYDDRKRDITLESSRKLMIQKVDSILPDLQSKNDNFSFRVKYYLGGDDYCIMESNYSREALFVLDHTIHHLAIMKLAIHFSFPNLYVPDELGFTASTIRAKNAVKA